MLRDPAHHSLYHSCVLGISSLVRILEPFKTNKWATFQYEMPYANELKSHQSLNVVFTGVFVWGGDWNKITNAKNVSRRTQSA